MKNDSSCRFSFRTLGSFLIMVLLLTGCGPATPAGTANSSTPSNTAEATSTIQHAYENTDRSTTAGGLFIKLSGFICTEGPFLQNLTIASDRPTYDAGSAQMIQNYLQLLANNSDVRPSGFYESLTTWLPPSPPAALKWVPGGTKCKGDFWLTNKTHQTINVERFGMQLTAEPVINDYQYRRIPITSQCPTCGAGGSCDYEVTVALNGGNSNSKFDESLTSSDTSQCRLPMSIPSVDENVHSMELLVTFQDAQLRDILYKGAPFLTIEGQKPIVLTDLTSNLSFVHSDALPCYQFQNNTFVPDHTQKLGCS